MPRGVNTCITWSMLELKGLLEDENTCVYFQRAKRHLGLHPFYLNDLNRALREILDADVNCYDASLQGLVLAYKNPKLVSPLGAILHDSYFIHIDVEADFYVFKPEIGCVLKGIANKKATNHVGVLVHKAFNVSIPKPEDCDEWLGDYVYVGQEVKFTVTSLDFKGKLPFVRGELISDGISHSTYYKEDSIVTSDREYREQTLISDAVNSPIHDAVDCESKKKSSKKSRVIDSSGDELSDEDDERKVFRKEEPKNRDVKNDELPREKLKAKNKRRVLDSSSEGSSEEEQRKVKPKEAHKRQRVSSESEDETSRKRKAKGRTKKVFKENGSRDTSTEPPESVDKTPKSLNVEKSAKKKKSSKEDESSDTCIEPEKSADRKPKVKSLKVEKRGKKKRSKEDGNSDTSIEPEKSVDGEPKIKSLNTTKSGKKKSLKEDGSSDTSFEPEESLDRKPKVNSLIVEKSVKKKSFKENGNLETCSEELIDRKPSIDESLKVEKPAKDKHKKVESTSNPPEDSEQQDTKFAVGRILPVRDDEDLDCSEDVISPKKRSKKNRIIDSDSDDTTEVEIKSEIRAKKKTKSKKHKEKADKSDPDEETAANTSQNAGTFEFIKPEIKPEHKRKRRNNIAENDESGGASQSSVVENKELTSDFFRDIRIKAEPDPSDVEDAAPREKSVKRKRKHSAVKEEDSTRTANACDDESSFRNVGIKTEPDASDIEDTKPPGKKKSKRKHPNKALLEDIKIKVEPNASDVEDSKPNSRFKTEPQENNVKTSNTVFFSC